LEGNCDKSLLYLGGEIDFWDPYPLELSKDGILSSWNKRLRALGRIYFTRGSPIKIWRSRKISQKITIVFWRYFDHFDVLGYSLANKSAKTPKSSEIIRFETFRVAFLDELFE